MKMHFLTTTIVLVLVGSAACTEEEQKPEAPIIRPVVSTVVRKPGGDTERAFSGVANAATSTSLSFRVSGEIVELPAKVGKKVKPGDLIASLDTTEYELEVKRSQAELSSALAMLRQAKSDYQRTRSLYEISNVSKRDLDSAQAHYQTSLAQHEVARKSLELNRKQLEYCKLKAPVAGRIDSVHVKQNQNITAGQTIAGLTSGSEMEMDLGVPEALINQLDIGYPATVSFDSIEKKEFKARISELGVTTTETTTYPVTLALLEQDQRVRPGMVGEAKFVLKTDRKFITVPPVAVSGASGGKNHVWVVDTDKNIVHKQEVKVGELTTDGLQIKSGLKSGDRIVTRGLNRLSEGMSIRLLH